MKSSIVFGSLLSQALAQTPFYLVTTSPNVPSLNNQYVSVRPIPDLCDPSGKTCAKASQLALVDGSRDGKNASPFLYNKNAWVEANEHRTLFELFAGDTNHRLAIFNKPDTGYWDLVSVAAPTVNEAFAPKGSQLAPDRFNIANGTGAVDFDLSWAPKRTWVTYAPPGGPKGQLNIALWDGSTAHPKVEIVPIGLGARS